MQQKSIFNKIHTQNRNKHGRVEHQQQNEIIKWKTTDIVQNQILLECGRISNFLSCHN